MEYLWGVLIVVGLMAVVWSNYAEVKRRKEEREEKDENSMNNSHGHVKVSKYDDFVREGRDEGNE